MAAKPGQSFLDQVIARLPESARESARTLFSSADAAAAVDYVGTQVAPLSELETQRQALETQRQTLAQKESRLTAWHASLDDWRQKKEAALAAHEARLQKSAGSDTADAPALTPPAGAGLTPEAVRAEVAKALDGRESLYAGAIAETNAMSVRHFQQFGEVLDLSELFQHPKLNDLGLPGVYQLVHAAKLETARAKQATEAEQKIREDERKKVLAEQDAARVPDLPYPIGGGDSPLDVLALEADKRPKGDPAAAARLYTQLVRENAGVR